MGVKIDVIIPAYKPGERFARLVEMLNRQTVKIHKIIVMNTEEKHFSQFIYGSSFLEKNANVEVYHVSRREFNHGKTRNEGARRSEASILVFMTDDAVPADEHLIEELLKPLVRPETAVVYARQLPEETSGEIEKFTRTYNYPDQDMVKTLKDEERLGVKTYFCSNVCAAYKRYLFDELGGFVKYTIFNEDMLFAAKAIKAGKTVCYASRARVYHTHNYTNLQQFRRNFDLAVSQADHPEVFAGVSSEEEGLKYAAAAKRYFRELGKPWLFASFVVKSGFKYAGFWLGSRYRKLPRKLILKCTMNRPYWERYWEKTDIPENVYAGYGKSEKES